MLSKFKLPILIFAVSFGFLFLHYGVKAAETLSDYKLLAPLPGIEKTAGITDINTYIPGLVKLIIGLASGLAVLRIIFGGIQYMSTDAFDGKNEAKNTINNALIGLLLAIGAYAILSSINPNLVDFKISITQQGCTSGSTGCSINGTIGNQQLNAIDVGCTNNCSPIDPNKVPIKTPGACNNDPCFVQVDMNSKLNALGDELTGKVGWQVTTAFPPITTQTDTCLKPNTNTTGQCADVAMTTAVTNITALKSFLDGLITVFGIPKFKYYVCEPRFSTLKSSSQLTAEEQSVIYRCNSTSDPENARVNI